MTSTPDQPDAGGSADFEPDPSLGYPEWDQDGQVLGPSLTMAEIAELNRLDGGPDDEDPWYQDDPERGAPPEWLALPSSEQAQLVEEACARSEVPEAIAAGFTHRYGGNGTGFRAGGGADQMLPGADLARHVGQAVQRGLDALSDDELIGFAGGAGKLESWASGLKHAAVIELDARRARPDGREGEHVAAEAAKALTLTPRSAQTLLERARGLDRLGQVLMLLCAGIIDVRKADVVLHRLCLLPDSLAVRVLDLVLPRAAGLTSGELGAALDTAIKSADPAAARKRREKAQEDARVEVWSEDAGTAALAGRDLDPAEVIAADQQLTADAQWLKANGVEGTMNQLRAKALTARASGRPLSSLLPPAVSPVSPANPGTGQAASAGGPTSADAPGALAGSVNLTVPASAWLGLSDRPGDAASYGPIDADTCRDLAELLAAGGVATQWCLTLVDDQGRAVGHGCARASPPPRASDRIAWLASIKITTIAAGSCDHQHESPGYRPPESLRHLIKIRSPRCGEPGCRTPARHCDDDHTIPYHLGGKSCECNLHPECRRSHRTKQARGWHVTQPEPGVLVWTTPSGRSYTNITEPLPV